jgi:predicted DNA-binding protein
MIRENRKNLHVPLPEGLYRRLRAEAERTRRPATDLAREAIDHWLAEARRESLRNEIAGYAQSVGGSDDDLSPEVEAAAIEHVFGEVTPKTRARGKRK